MATITGRVIFDRDRSAAISGGDSGLADVPVVLQNVDTDVRLTVLTDASGNYSFLNVPSGSYRIVEAYGTPGGSPTPGDFALATVGDVPGGAAPPIAAAVNPPAGANHLDFVTPDTLLVSVTGADLINQNFLNGPVIYTPIQAILDPCATIGSDNLIDAADEGTFGSFPQGTPANTGAPVEPYPEVTPDFTYVLPNPAVYAPTGGEYTVQNIMNDALSEVIGAWWRIADHTTGNATGRMMVVNGYNPGAVFFRDVVEVKPNTNYLFTSWILNLFKVTGYPNPELGVRVLGQNGNVLYSATLGTLIPVSTSAPEWKQIGSVINSRDNARLTVEFLSEGPEVIGNDYAIDDVSLSEIQVPQFIPVKTVDRQTADVGETVHYTVTLTNTCQSPLTDVFFLDSVPDGLAFVPGSVTINGASIPTVDPGAGFTLPNVSGGQTVTVAFSAVVRSIPAPNPALNHATIDYSYTPVEGGIPGEYHVISNEVPVLVGASADVSVVKTAAPSPVEPGDALTYTVTVANAGPSPAENAVLTDAVPSELSDAAFSTDGGATWQSWPGFYALGTLAAGSAVTLLIRGTVSASATGSIVNTAVAASDTPDPNPDNNADTEVTPVAESADVSVVKLGSPYPVLSGDSLTYTLTVSNAGPSTAVNVVVTDAVPASLSDVEFSLDNGVTFQPWAGAYALGDLAPGTVRTVLIRGVVLPTAIGSIVNTAAVSSDTPDPNPDNNTSTDETLVETRADLAVTKTGSPSPVPAGGELLYTVVVTNRGPSDAQGVTLTDALPPELSGAAYSLDGGVTFLPWGGAVGLGTLASGASRTVLIRGQVNAASGTIANTAVVDSDTPDPNPDDNRATEITPIDTSADLSVTKVGNPSPAIPGQYLIYTVTLTNGGPDPAVSAVLTDGVPSALLNAAYSVDGGTTWTPWTGAFAAGTLASGESRTVLIRGIVNPAATGILENTAVVGSDTPDPNPDNNQDTSLVPIGASADLSVLKTAYPAPVTAGGLLTYTITVFNAGPSTAQGVVLSDVLTAEVTNPEFAVQGGTDFAPWSSPYSIGTLAAGERFTVTLRGVVAPSTPVGELVNTAVVTGDTPDPNPDDNDDTAQTPVEVLADVSVVKTAEMRPAIPGEAFGYVLAVTNAGPSDARNVTLIDAIPAGLENPLFSVDGGVTFAPWVSPYLLGTLPAGERAEILIRGTLSAAATGEIVNTAVAGSTTPDPNPDNNTSTDTTPIQPSADLSVVKTASPSPVPAGGTISYTLLIANAGPSTAEGVVLADALPAGLEDAEISADGGATFAPFDGAYAVGSLEAGASRRLLIRAAVSPLAGGLLVNTAQVESVTPDPNPDNNSSTVETPVLPSADLSIVKSATPNPVEPGGVLTYTLTVENAGPASAQGVVVRDNLPSELLGAEFSTDGGATWMPWPGAHALGTVAAGDVRILLLRGTVSPTAGGSLTNIAVVVSDTPDPNPINNEDTNRVDIIARASADLSVTKRASPTSAAPGEPVTYTITLTNQGPDDAEAVTLFDAISPELTEAEFSLDGGATWAPWENPYPLGTLAAGRSVEILLRANVAPYACGTVSNTAVVSSVTPDPDPDNNTASADVSVQSGADLSIQKTAFPNPALRCQHVTFILTVFNAGPGTARRVTIADPLSRDLDCPIFSADQGRTWQAWGGSVDVGDLAAGSTATVLVAGIVGACAGGCILNTASVSSETPDPVPSNNTAMIAVTVWADCRRPGC